VERICANQIRTADDKETVETFVNVSEMVRLFAEKVPATNMLELFAWGPGYGQYSLDPFCLSIEAYLQLSGVKWVVNESDSNISPTGELPLLKINAEPITGTWNIVKVLKQRGHDLDDRLTQQELFETQAFVALMEEKLHDALVFEIDAVVYLVLGKRKLYEIDPSNHVQSPILPESIYAPTTN
jgi:hypothetical protein